MKLNENTDKLDRVIEEPLDVVRERPHASGLTATLIMEGFNTSRMTHASLIRLAHLILSKAGNADPSAEILLHLPNDLIEDFSEYIKIKSKLKAGEFITFNGSIYNTKRSGYRQSGQIPAKHPLKDELLIVIVGQYICGLVSAIQIDNIMKNRSQVSLYTCALSFRITEVNSTIDVARNMLTFTAPRSGPANVWLAKASNLMYESANTSDQSRMWGEFTTELTSGLEEDREKKEKELKWYQLISRVQDAVAWELDTGKLFSGISQVLKTTLGFHYLEIQLLEPRNDKYDVTAVHHRNDTTFGGQLLTVILKPEKRLEILKSQKPRLIEPDDAQDMLMNPKLMGYMGFSSGIVIPLAYQRRVNGFLKLFSHEKNHFSIEDIYWMETIGRMISRSIENVKSHSLMRRMATIDGLTGLFNRRSFNEQLNREFKRSKRYDNDLTLIMLDVDHFKHYNDTFGHLTGDKVLITVAQILKQCVREVDIVARYGGEEFAVILPEADVERGLVVAEKIRKTIEEYPFKFGEHQPGGKLSLSLGLAANTADVDTTSELINRSDTALYRAKNAGRNRCEAF